MNISRSNECGIMKILTVFHLLVGGSTVRIFLCFEICRHKLPFSVCGYRFQNGWDFKGMADSFDSGFPIGVKAPCWHTILLAKSSVLYLLRPPHFAEMHWKGAVPRQTDTFRRQQNRRILWAERNTNEGFSMSKIRLFGCSWHRKS